MNQFSAVREYLMPGDILLALDDQTSDCGQYLWLAGETVQVQEVRIDVTRRIATVLWKPGDGATRVFEEFTVTWPGMFRRVARNQRWERGTW